MQGPPAAVTPASRPAAAPSEGPRYVVLTGNPNCGKTTLFNALTGLRAKVGNYAGVTVERKEGRLQGAPTELHAQVLDLPGTYSLSPQSLDEQIARDVLLSRLPELPPPALIVVVVDAFNLQRNLYYASQVIELGHPTAIALNMVDVAEQNGHRIDAAKLAEQLGVPVLPVIASSGQGVNELRRVIVALLPEPKPPGKHRFPKLPEAFVQESQKIAAVLTWNFKERRTQADAEALLILSNEQALASSREHYPAAVLHSVAAARQRLEAGGVDWRSAAIEARYTTVAQIAAEATTEFLPPGETWSDRVDRVVTHRIWGTLIFLAIMALMFQSIFTFARLPMDALQVGVDWLAGAVGHAIPPGDLNSLLADGIVAGVGAVVVFLPQILLLFLFIGFLEDSGYMARAAFLMDRVMSKVGLHGKSFIPMLSSFACAIPGIMATRTIESPKDRLATILIAPLMSCSARLPVYTLLIAACIPQRHFLAVFHLQGLTLLSMYLLGLVVALLMAWVFKKTLLKGEPPLLIMELPPYRRPLLRIVFRHMWDRAKLFIQRAGTVILGINIILWFLATYPRSADIDEQYAQKRMELAAVVFPQITSRAELAARAAELRSYNLVGEGGVTDLRAGERAIIGKTNGQSLPGVLVILSPHQVAAFQRFQALDSERAGDRLRRSFAGMLGRAIEPLITPLGFDWKIGIGIVTSFAAREVFVSTMSTVYSVSDTDSKDSELGNLVRTLRAQTRPDGSPLYTPLLGVTLMVFYVFALQCASTVAIVRRETNSWKWPLFQWAYMGLLAWGLAFITYQGGRLLGLS